MDKINNLIPFILKKNSIQEKFDPNRIYNSLLKETSISEENAKKVTEDVVRFLVSIDLKIVTAPLIREIANVQLLKLKLEKERLEYTRIGFPRYDLNKLYVNDKCSWEIKHKMILRHIDKEFDDVNTLIEKNNIQ